MRALAEFVMRGRREAVLTAVIATMVPMFFWLGTAVVGLVTLRKGAREGALVLMWALLPASVAAYFGEIMPLAALLGTMVVAWVLRLTASWPWTLCSASALGLLLGGGLITVGRGYLAHVEKLFAEVVNGIAQQATVDAPVHAMLKVPSAGDIAGMFGLILAVVLVLGLIFARWWQAVLFNAGGFRAEFHALRLERRQVLGLLLLAFAFAALGDDFRLWIWMPLVPLVFAGVGLVHALLAQRGMSAWLGFFYAALLLFAPLKQFLVVLAAMDGWIDMRGWAGRKPGA